MSNVLLKSTEILKEYKENIILITFFLITYYTFKKFFHKERFTPEEKFNRQKLANDFLDKYKVEDNDFFYGGLINSDSTDN